MSTSSTPFYYYNQNPYQLFCWPQSSNPMVSPLEIQNGSTAPFTTSGGASAKTMTSQENGVPFTFQDPQRVASSNGHHLDSSSAKPVEVTKSLRSHLPTSIKEEDSGSTETRPLYDLNESISFKHEDVSDSPNGVTPMVPGHNVLIKQGSLAAAEARKRRKELTKLKNLHGRKCV